MRNTLFAALAAAAFATPAFAQGASNQSGFRIEGLVGYDHPRVSGDHGDGVLYGLGVGYDVQAGHMLVGIEGEASDSTADERVNGFAVAGDELRVRAGRDLYVGGRIGALVGANTLLYVKAGYTNARVRVDYDDGTAATVADFTDRSNLDGIRAGVGAQFGIGSNAYIRTEYRYSNYENGVDRHQLVGGFGFRF